MLVTLAEMKSYLSIPAGTTTNDAFLTAQVSLVSEAIEAYCRRVFSLGDYIETHYSTDYPIRKTIETFHYPLTEVESIVEDDVELSTDDYRIHKPTGTLTKVAGFHQCVETVITYTAGLAVIPSPITNAVYSLVEERYNKKSSGVNLNFGSDVQRVSIPGAISIDFDYSLNNNDRKNAFGLILGAHLNALDYYRSERAIVGMSKLVYVEVVPEGP